MIRPAQRDLLRNLAKQVAGIAADPIQEQRRKRWYAHNRLEHGRPMVFTSPEGSWLEILPEDSLTLHDEPLRGWEWTLRQRIWSAANLHDDHVIDTFLDVGQVAQTTGWGLEEEYHRSDTERGAYKWDAPLKDPADLEKLTEPTTTVDENASRQILETAHDIFDGILQVRQKRGWWWTLGVIGELARLRGLEQIMLDMLDNPAFVHRAMRFMTDAKLRWLDSLAEQGLLCLNNANDYVGSGSMGFTNELPADDHAGRVRPQDMWGFCEAQEIALVSPAMHEEFVLQYQLDVHERFGLNYYGCCEPLERKLDMLEKIPRLRKISVSPFSDYAAFAEGIGDKYVYHWKPHPAPLAEDTFPADRVRAYQRETLEATKGCILEISLKDTHTCRHDPSRFTQWTQMLQEEIDRVW